MDVTSPETLGHAIKRLAKHEPLTWDGEYHIHCVGKTGELIYLSGALPDLREQAPRARLVLHTMEAYRPVVEGLHERFDGAVYWHLVSGAGSLSDQVTTHYSMSHAGWIRAYEGGGLQVHAYWTHAHHARRLNQPPCPFPVAFAQALGARHYRWPSGWGVAVGDEPRSIALALRTANYGSSMRGRVPFSDEQWGLLAAALRLRGLRPMMTGRADDGPTVPAPGWEWLEGDVTVALESVKRSGYVLGLNSGMVFAALVLSDAAVVMLDDSMHTPHNTTLDRAGFPEVLRQRFTQVRLPEDRTLSCDAAFDAALKAAQGPSGAGCG